MLYPTELRALLTNSNTYLNPLYKRLNRKIFWFNIEREIFKRTKAEFVSINCQENHETSLTYKPQTRDEPRLGGKNNKKK